MTVESKDLIVLGAGPGGYIAAIRAAQLGRHVTIVEKDALGGVCLNWGCIPSKALLKSAQFFYDMKHHAGDFGFSATGLSFDFPKVINRSREVAGKLSNGVNYLMRKNKIEVVGGAAKILKGNNLELIDGSGKKSTLAYKDLIIATGARSRNLPGIEPDGEVIHNYRTLLDYRKLPQKTLVVGAGAIGIEFGYFQASFGTQVTIVEMADQILPMEDTEISQGLERVFKKRGIIIKTSAGVSNIKKSGNTVSATIKTKEGEEQWSGDCLLVAIGFTGNSEGIGLEEVGIITDRSFIKVDEFMRTNVPHHYAIGDVVGAPMLAHVASHEGIVAAEHAAGKAKHGMRYDNIPACTYCQPQVASVGLTERAVKEKGIKYKVGKVPFSAMGKAIASGEQDGMMKVIIDEEVGEVLGVHILHAEASELIAEAGIIRSHEGVAASVVDTIHAHPTLSESLMEAMAAALGRPLNT
jgi:dihydrolipoamide dehydrogenase